MAISRGGFRRPTGRRIPYSASLRCKFVLRSTTAFCKAKTPNVAPVHRFAVSGSHDQASYEKQKSRCVASTFLFLAGAEGFEPATHGFGVPPSSEFFPALLPLLHTLSAVSNCRFFIWYFFDAMKRLRMNINYCLLECITVVCR